MIESAMGRLRNEGKAMGQLLQRLALSSAVSSLVAYPGSCPSVRNQSWDRAVYFPNLNLIIAYHSPRERGKAAVRLTEA